MIMGFSVEANQSPLLRPTGQLRRRVNKRLLTEPLSERVNRHIPRSFLGDSIQCGTELSNLHAV